LRRANGNGVRAALAALLLAACATAGAQDQTLVTAGAFTKIYDPSAGEPTPWYINDHTFIFGRDNMWHMVGITHADPASPEMERNLAHATARSLLQVPWDNKPFALTFAPGAPWNETHLWAPYVISSGDTYYMYYCAGDHDHGKYKIHLATSRDLVTWTRSPSNPMVVDGYDARDPFVMRLRDKWVLYYTATSAPSGGHHLVASVTSTDLVSWGDKRVVYIDPDVGTYGGSTESPFVVRRGSSYYLLVGPRPEYDGTDVFVSHDPFAWTTGHKVGHIPAHAAEVVRDTDGKWYVSRCGWGEGGVYLAPLTWHDGEDDSDTSMPVPGSPSAGAH
jgi:arabinan endo-1,5-alpha-L-arabinosidase